MQLTLHRRRPGSCQGIQETPELAKKEEGKALQSHQTRSWTTCDFTSNFSSSPTKQKKTKNHSPSYIHTHKRNSFLRGGRKKNPGNSFEGKRLFIAAKVLIFFFCLWQLYKNWRLQQRRNPFTCHHIKPLCSTEEMAKFHP